MSGDHLDKLKAAFADMSIDEFAQNCSNEMGVDLHPMTQSAPKPETDGDARTLVAKIREWTLDGWSFVLTDDQAAALLASSQGQGDNPWQALVDLYGLVTDYATIPDEEYHKIANAADLIQSNVGPLRKAQPQPEAREEDDFDAVLQTCADYCRLGTDGHLHMQRQPIEEALKRWALSRLAAKEGQGDNGRSCSTCGHATGATGCGPEEAYWACFEPGRKSWIPRTAAPATSEKPKKCGKPPSRIDRAISIIRNPFGIGENEIKASGLLLCDEIETLRDAYTNLSEYIASIGISITATNSEKPEYCNQLQRRRSDEQ